MLIVCKKTLPNNTTLTRLQRRRIQGRIFLFYLIWFDLSSKSLNTEQSRSVVDTFMASASENTSLYSAVWCIQTNKRSSTSTQCLEYFLCIIFLCFVAGAYISILSASMWQMDDVFCHKPYCVSKSLFCVRAYNLKPDSSHNRNHHSARAFNKAASTYVFPQFYRQ